MSSCETISINLVHLRAHICVCVCVCVCVTRETNIQIKRLRIYCNLTKHDCKFFFLRNKYQQTLCELLNIIPFPLSFNKSIMNRSKSYGNTLTITVIVFDGHIIRCVYINVSTRPNYIEAEKHNDTFVSISGRSR